MSYSQVGQDLFALKLIGKNGYFLDIGAGWDYSGVNSNSLLLEQEGWNGICIEGDKTSFEYRRSMAIRAYMANAFIPQTSIKSILKLANAPNIIDYVSIDIEPMALIGLQNFPFEEYSFKVLTFEHDLYRLGPDQKNQSFEILNSLGYVRLCDNVNVPESQGIGLFFEDWWVNPMYFSSNMLSNIFTNQLGTYIIKNLTC